MKYITVATIILTFTALSVVPTFAQNSLQRPQTLPANQSQGQISQQSPAIQRPAQKQLPVQSESRAVNEINRRITILTNLIEKINKSNTISDDVKEDWTTQIQEQITSLTELKTDIESEDQTVANEMNQTVRDTYGDFAVYMPKFRTLLAAQSIQMISEKMMSVHEKMATEVTNLSDLDIDTAAMEQMLIDSEENITSAQDQATEAIELVTPLTGDEYPGNRTVFQNARTLIRDGRLELVAARDSLKNLYSEIKNAQNSGDTESEEIVEDAMMMEKTSPSKPTGTFNIQKSQ